MSEGHSSSSEGDPGLPDEDLESSESDNCYDEEDEEDDESSGDERITRLLGGSNEANIETVASPSDKLLEKEEESNQVLVSFF
jgi:hypothetical protein